MRAICHVITAGRNALRTECVLRRRLCLRSIDRKAKAVIFVRKFGNRCDINKNALNAAN